MWERPDAADCCSVDRPADGTSTVVSVKHRRVNVNDKGLAKISSEPLQTFGVPFVPDEVVAAAATGDAADDICCCCCCCCSGCKLPWLPSTAVAPVNERAGTGGRRGGTTILLLSCDERNSRFSRSRAACCSFNSLMADISSNFCVSSEERDSISCGL